MRTNVLCKSLVIKIMFDLSIIDGSVHQEMITTFFRSTFSLFELIMLCLLVYFMVKHPTRRLRLISLAVFHFASVLVLPMAFKDFRWMAVLYPWPQTLLVFDPKTPSVVLGLSLFVGFLVIPFLTFKWGAKGFCGYVCPHGAFYSEAYGRLFAPPLGRLNWMRKCIPLLYFTGMVLAALSIILAPPTLDPIRRGQ